MERAATRRRNGYQRWSLLAAIVLTVMSMTFVSGPTVQGSSPSVTLYQNTGFAGTSLTVTASVACLTDRPGPNPDGNWNDVVSSIRLDGDVAVTLYEHCRNDTRFPGASLVLSASASNLASQTAATADGPKPWNTIISALDLVPVTSTPTPTATPTSSPGPSPIVSKTVASLPPVTADSWMEQLGDEIAGKSLMQLVLPGSHDAAATHAENTLILGDSAPIGVRAAGSLIASPWAEAQGQTIASQLSLGIRYLDLRVEKSHWPQAPGFRIVHSILFDEVSNVLQEVADFINAHEKEIIILDFQDLYEFDSEADHQAFKALVRSKIPVEKIVKNDGTHDPHTMTIGEMWHDQQQVVIFYTGLNEHPDPDTAVDQSFWKRADYLKSKFTQDCDMLDLTCLYRTRQEFLDQADASGYVDKLFVFQGQLTPADAYPVEANASVACDVLAFAFTFGTADCPDYAYSLEQAAVNSNRPFLTYLLRNWIGRHFNVVILDFFDKVLPGEVGGTTFTDTLVELNRTAPKETVAVAPSASGPGVTATLHNATAGSDPATVDVFTYPINPTDQPVFDVGGGYLDLKVTGADLGDRVEATFYYPPTVTGTAEQELLLLYYTGEKWIPVVSSIWPLFRLPTKDTTDNQKGTTSGGSFTAEFSAYSIPNITQLTGTVFSFTTDTTAPVPVHNGPLTVVEGGTVTLDGSASTDDLGVASIAWDIDGDGFDDGNPVVFKGVDGPATVTVSLQVVDGAGNEAVVTTQVTVTNAAPLVTAGNDLTVDEGAAASLVNAAFLDPGAQDTHTVTVTWGDGTGVQPAASTGADGFGTITGTHVYGDNGTYTATVCVTDDDHATTCDQLVVMVHNVKPSVNAGPDQTTDEGTFITLAATYTDPGFDNPPGSTQENFTATVNWGDGNVEPLGDITPTETPGSGQTPTAGTVRAMHAYGDNGTYTATVCVTDDDHATTCDTLAVTVHNVKPSVNAGPDVTINESGTVTLAPATYSDPGFDNPPDSTQENFTAAIDWGEGTVDVGVLTEAPGTEGRRTTGTVSGSHVYGDDGPYVVTVCVTDDDQATTCDTLVVTSQNLAPVLDDNSFLDDGIVFTSNELGFLGRKGVRQTHDATATDQGSDDLRFSWSYTGNPDEFGGAFPPVHPTDFETYFNSGAPSGALPFADPATDNEARPHPHGVFPFTASDTSDVTFTAPGMYLVSLSVTDDNSGADAISLPKVVVDDSTCTRSQGFWGSELQKAAEGKTKGRKLDDNTLRAYLDVVNFTSSVFSESVPAATLTAAAKVMGPGGTGVGDPNPNNMKGKAVKDALAAWLNFATGAVTWDGLTPTGQTFATAIAQVETIIRDPNAVHADYVQAKSIAEAINLMAPQCAN